MNQLGLLWKNFSDKINALTVRERGILFLVLAGIILLLMNKLFIEPAFTQQKAMADRIRQDQAQMSVLYSEIAQLVGEKRVDPDAENKSKLAALQSNLTQIENRILETQSHLVPPDKMGLLIEDILKRNRHLQLISLKSLPVKNVLAEDGSTPANAIAGEKLSAGHGAIYKHEVELVVQGTYLDMLAYMRMLENMPQQVYWDTTQMQVEEYPNARLTLRVFTLSLDKSWLSL